MIGFGQVEWKLRDAGSFNKFNKPLFEELVVISVLVIGSEAQDVISFTIVIILCCTLYLVHSYYLLIVFSYNFKCVWGKLKLQ